MVISRVLGSIRAVDEIALVFIAEVVAEDAFDPVPFLLDHQLGQVVVVHTGQVDVCPAIPGAGNGLGPQEGGCGYKKDDIIIMFASGVFVSDT
jgi:hypothetical protein